MIFLDNAIPVAVCPCASISHVYAPSANFLPRRPTSTDDQDRPRITKTDPQEKPSKHTLKTNPPALLLQQHISNTIGPVLAVEELGKDYLGRVIWEGYLGGLSGEDSPRKVSSTSLIFREGEVWFSLYITEEVREEIRDEIGEEIRDEIRRNMDYGSHIIYQNHTPSIQAVPR